MLKTTYLTINVVYKVIVTNCVKCTNNIFKIMKICTYDVWYIYKMLHLLCIYISISIDGRAMQTRWQRSNVPSAM